MEKSDEKSLADEEQLVLFVVGHETYGLDIRHVERLLPIPPITPIPGAPRCIAGVTEVRGEVVPLVNMKSRLGHDDVSYDKTGRVIIVEAGDVRLGLLVDEVNEVFRLASAAVESRDEAVVRMDDPLVRGIGKDGSRLLILVDTAAVLPSEEAKAVAARLPDATACRAGVDPPPVVSSRPTRAAAAA